MADTDTCGLGPYSRNRITQTQHEYTTGAELSPVASDTNVPGSPDQVQSCSLRLKPEDPKVDIIWSTTSAAVEGTLQGIGGQRHGSNPLNNGRNHVRGFRPSTSLDYPATRDRRAVSPVAPLGVMLQTLHVDIQTRITRSQGLPSSRPARAGTAKNLGAPVEPR